jgi:hypothetical protein
MLLVESNTTTNINDSSCIAILDVYFRAVVLASKTKQIKQTAIQYNKTNNTTTNKLFSTRNQGVCITNNKSINLIFILLFYFIEIVCPATLSLSSTLVLHATR